MSSWGSVNYRPSAPHLYDVASHVKQLPFRPLLLLLLPRKHQYQYQYQYLCAHTVRIDDIVLSNLHFTDDVDVMGGTEKEAQELTTRLEKYVLSEVLAKKPEQGMG